MRGTSNRGILVGVLFAALSLIVCVGCGDDDQSPGNPSPDASVEDTTESDTQLDAVHDDALFDVEEDLVTDVPEEDVPPTGTAFANIFAGHACHAEPGEHLRDEYCGGASGGTPADFDEARFESLYLNLDDTVLYPTGGSGPLTRVPVPLCEDGTDELNASGDCASDGKPTIRCTDGTRPISWVRLPDAGVHSNDWMMWVQGGGRTCGTHDDESNCFARAPVGGDFTSLGESAAIGTGGIFSSNRLTPDSNFHEFGLVYLDKCVGDRNVGAGEVDDAPYYFTDHSTYNNGILASAAETDAGHGPLYFHGRRIVFAVVGTLVAQNQLQDGSRLIVGGHSNGSNGLYQYLDDLAAHVDSLVGGDVDVRGILSSFLQSSTEVENFLATGSWRDYSLGGTVDAPSSTVASLTAFNETYRRWPADYRYDERQVLDAADGAVLADSAYQPGGAEYQRWEDWGGSPDESCLAALDRWACLSSMHVVAGYLETPAFMAFQSGDRGIRNFDMPFAVLDESLPGLTFHPDDFRVRLTALLHRVAALDQGHAAFMSLSDDHISFTNPAKARREIGGLSMADAMYNWVMAPPGTGGFCVMLPPADRGWYHFVDGTDNDLIDAGADPAFACPGSSF